MIPSLVARFETPLRAQAGPESSSGWPEQDLAVIVSWSAHLHRPGEPCMLRERRMVKASGPPRHGAFPAAHSPTASLVRTASGRARRGFAREKGFVCD